MNTHSNIRISPVVTARIIEQGGIKSVWPVRTGYWMLVQWNPGMKPVFKFTRGTM